MRFNSEKERMQHPQARLIPKSIWSEHFNSEISTMQMELMQISSDRLPNLLRALNGSDDKFELLLCCAFRTPPLSDNDLISMAEIIQLPLIQQLGIAAIMGRVEMLNRLIALAPTLVPPVLVQDMIKASRFRAFRLAAENGHLEVINRLIALAPTLVPPVSVQDMIKSKSFAAFRSAAANGHLDVMNRLIALAPTLVPPVLLQDMIEADDFGVYHNAAENGHLDVINRIIALALTLVPPVLEQDMIKADDFRVFRNAAENGHLDFMNRLIALAQTLEPPVRVQDMIEANDFMAFRLAALKGHLDVINRLIELAPTLVPPVLVQDMIKADDFRAFHWAAEKGHLDVVNKLLTFPLVFAYAELHQSEYGRYVKPFIEKKLATLKLRQEARHPSVVVTQQEAHICFYILRHLIRHSSPVPSPEALSHIEFLIAIPVVQSLLHRPITPPDGTNELLREALRLGNRTVADRLFDIPEVRAQAERDGFYQTESRGGVDLRAMAQNRESSMSALSPQEQAMMQRLEKKYRPTINEIGLEKAFEDVYKAIIARYNGQPASFKRENGTSVQLPLTKTDFDQMVMQENFSELDKKKAMEAYYQHPTHTVFRYLSKPNPWMATNSAYVEVNPTTGERWSTFESYKDMITLLYLAAADASEPATDGFTRETRLDELVNEIALIGRAHNWDGTREKTDKEGQPVLDKQGNPVREEFDDLQGDKPSCYSGVKRRLFQALKGSPLFFTDIHALISLDLHQHLREHMTREFEKTDTHILESIQIGYAKVTQGEFTESLPYITQKLDVPEKTIQQWATELQGRYSTILSEEESQLIKPAFTDFFKQTQNLGSQFLALAERCQLDALCQQALQLRTNGLASEITRQTPTALIDFLNQEDEVTGESRLINAIHLGLLGTIGQHLGEEKFANLLSPDEPTREAYAGILATYADDARLDGWLSGLDASIKSSFIKEIHEQASEEVQFSPVDRFNMFLRNLDTKRPEIRELFKQTAHLKTPDSKELGTILNTWLDKNTTSRLVSEVLNKAQELGFVRTNTSTQSTTCNSISSSSSEDGQLSADDAPAVTFEELPDDLTGEILQQVEDQEQQTATRKQTSARFREEVSAHRVPDAGSEEQNNPRP